MLSLHEVKALNFELSNMVNENEEAIHPLIDDVVPDFF